jgi:hypothetical protein
MIPRAQTQCHSERESLIDDPSPHQPPLSFTEFAIRWPPDDCVVIASQIGKRILETQALNLAVQQILTFECRRLILSSSHTRVPSHENFLPQPYGHAPMLTKTTAETDRARQRTQVIHARREEIGALAGLEAKYRCGRARV